MRAATKEQLKDQLVIAADGIIAWQEFRLDTMGALEAIRATLKRADAQHEKKIAELRYTIATLRDLYTGWPQVRDRIICVAAGAVIASAGWLL